MAGALHTCGGCPATWSGVSLAHCSGCHVTFGGVTMFDEHRVQGACRTLPQLARRGVREVRPGVYGRPTPPQTPAEGVS